MAKHNGTQTGKAPEHQKLTGYYIMMAKLMTMT